MKLSEMIKVMQHYDNGGEVEYSHNNLNNVFGEAIKKHDGNLGWNWDAYNYRIKKEKQKVTIEKWLMQSTIDKEYRIFETSLVDTVAQFKKAKLLETYEIEL